VVLTGGTALLPGVAEAGEEVLGLPVRIGYPRRVGGLRDMVHSPVFSTALGLVMQGAAEEAEQARKTNGKPARKGGWIDRLFGWVREVV
jgi:cell division protein FtsA